MTKYLDYTFYAHFAFLDDIIIEVVWCFAFWVAVVVVSGDGNM